MGVEPEPKADTLVCMNLHTSNYRFADIGWYSLLPTADTQEMFSRAFQDLNLTGWSVAVRDHQSEFLGPNGLCRLTVGGQQGKVPRAAGLEPFMILVRALDMFPEALTAGFEDGEPLVLSMIDQADLSARYEGESERSIKALAARAGLVGAVRLTPTSGTSYPQIWEDSSVEKYRTAR